MIEGEDPMASRERLYTVDDVWRLACAPDNDARKICLIDGEMLVTMSPGQIHGRLALRIGQHIANYADEHNLGEATVEVGYHPPDDRQTLLIPDVAFEGSAQASTPASAGYAPFMPDLAVEIISPSQALAQARRKASVYLRHGTSLVWLVNPAEKSAEVWNLGSDGAPHSETIESEGSLDGGAVLPGFALPLGRLFPD